MKLILTEKGYDKFNGLFGITFFEDGVSVDDVPIREARNIAISIRCEYEDGTDPNPAQQLLESMNKNPIEASTETVAPVLPKFTREQLEEIADKEGIKGLREIATPLDIKSNSIAELIEALLEVK